MTALKVTNLCKNYPKFQLDSVSFELEKGYIMGFIGSNGAGKTTTLKAILNMIQNDGGEIEVFGKTFKEHEISLKQDIGYAFGGADFYTRNKIRTVTDVVKRFYTNWDEEIYQHYLKRFKLDPEKKIAELSEGMKVKYALALALSHHAKLFILDEPTSGLDPVARDNLLELFQELVEDGERSILFSTHITSDLEKCADYITFILGGKIVDSASKDAFLETYRLVKGKHEQLKGCEDKLIAYKSSSYGFTGLMKTQDLDEKADSALLIERPNLEEIMIYFAKKEEMENEKLAV